MTKAKWEKIEQARRDGMGYALGIVREKGIEGLEEDVRFRNISKVSVAMSEDEYKDLTERMEKRISQVILTLAEITLRDEFGFGKSRQIKRKSRMRGRGVYNNRGTVGNIGKRNGNVGQVEIRKVAFINV